ncbi:MAG: DUF1330 domain-containing protein [Pseudomonadota bacterium]
MTSLRSGEQMALDTYLSVVGPLMEKAGARLINRYEVSESLSGSEAPQFVSLVEYPDAEAIRMVFEDPDYLALEPVRETAFSCYEVCVLETS